MPNIDPIYLLPSIAITILGFAVLVYWKLKRKLRNIVLLYGLVAYAAAILVKVVFQDLTYKAVLAASGGSPVVLGLYFGLQTAILEVGFAYLVINYAVRKKNVKASDAEGYGISLGFWENGVLLGLISLINLLAVYAALAAGGPAAATVYTSISASNPQLFVAPSAAATGLNLLYAIMERASSTIIHFSWGYLVLLAAFYRKRRYLLVALPMGLIDFAVPFAASSNIAVFETVLLIISLAALGVTLYITKKRKRRK